MKEIKWLLTTKKVSVGTPFNTNILRLALNNKEETVAMILTSKYQVLIDEKMIIRAIKTRQLDFLYHVYGSNKNW